jgi:hypothetical protein
MFVAGLAAVVGVVTLLSGSADAAYSSCRVDPIVTLSDGTQITMYVTLGTDISSVLSVDYELHIPKTASVRSVTYDQYGSLEHLTVVQDQQPGNYHTYVTPYTKSSVSATAYAGVAGPTCLAHQSGTMTNTTPRTLPNQFNC